MDLAAAIQAVTEEVVLRLTRSLRKETGIRNLCLAGGVALNCVANGKVLRDRYFEQIYIQPAAGDAGGALGAALAAYHMQLGQTRRVNGDAMRGAYLGPAFAQTDTEARLRNSGATFDLLDDAALIAYSRPCYLSFWRCCRARLGARVHRHGAVCDRLAYAIRA